MRPFDFFTFLLIFLGAFSYLNARFVKLPATIAFMLGALVVSIIILALHSMGLEYVRYLIVTLGEIDFSTTVLYGILSFLLFAGSLQLDIRKLAEEKWVILVLATFGVIISTFLVGTFMYWVFNALGVNVPYVFALLFGALISPTDPVIVIGMLKEAKIPSSVKMKVMGESLFNDGIAIVLFVILLALTQFGADIGAGDVALMLLQQLGGSLVLGLLLGWITYHLLSQVDHDNVRVMITLGLVAGGYDLATILGTSGPITVVIMGLIVRNYRIDKRTRNFEGLYRFWELIDEFLNAGLFVLMGLQILALPFSSLHVIAAVCAIVVVLISRYISVALPIASFRLYRPFTRNVTLILTWMGLRGGISLALALSLSPSNITYAILTSTYMVVLFSTVVQGLSFRRFVSSQS